MYKAVLRRPINGSVVERLLSWERRGASFLKNRSRVFAPAPTVKVIDTVGAGDTFNAGFIYALCKGLSLYEAIRFAVRTASTAVSSLPRRYATPGEISEGDLIS